MYYFYSWFYQFVSFSGTLLSQMRRIFGVVLVIHCFFVPSNEGEKGTERGGCTGRQPHFVYLAVVTNLRPSAAFERIVLHLCIN